VTPEKPHSRLTVQVVEVLQLGVPGHGVVEVGLQVSALQETVGHLRQVDAHDGVGVPTTPEEGVSFRRIVGGVVVVFLRHRKYFNI